MREIYLAQKNGKVMLSRYLLLIVLMLSSVEYKAEDWQRLVNLKGFWKFSIGDDMSRVKPNYDDKDWETVTAPSSWENEGFNGYDGYAWYRKSFNASANLKDRTITLRLGRIDDVDEVYLNGYLIGATGTFPPEYNTAYFAWREYHVPQKYLNIGGENVIAIRVYDSELEGGLIEGDLGLYEKKYTMRLDLDLAGEWNFTTGDDMDWKEKNYDDKKWDKIFVPANWERQIGDDYDGFAWYRLTFSVPQSLKGKKLVLVLGKIDDIDEAYLNGKQIGSTGNLNSFPVRHDTRGEYKLTRGYFIPDGLLEYGKENIVAVRVYDGFRDGGIYEGPIGLIEQSKYTKYWRNYKPPKQKKDIWDLIFQ